MTRTQNASKDYPTAFFKPFESAPHFSVQLNLWNKSISWPSASLQSIEDAKKFRDALNAAIEEGERL
jgi:hypothetical protein